MRSDGYTQVIPPLPYSYRLFSCPLLAPTFDVGVTWLTAIQVDRPAPFGIDYLAAPWLLDLASAAERDGPAVPRRGSVD